MHENRRMNFMHYIYIAAEEKKAASSSCTVNCESQFIVGGN